MEELWVLQRSGAINELAAAAHKLAGSAGAFGFEQITREAKSLDDLARNGALPDQLTAPLTKLTEACAHARNQLAGPKPSPV